MGAAFASFCRSQMMTHMLGAIRMSVDYEPSQPTTVQQQAQLERAVTTADGRGLRILLSITDDDPHARRHSHVGRLRAFPADDRAAAGTARARGHDRGWARPSHPFVDHR